MPRSKASKIEIKPTTAFIPKGVSIEEKALSEERPGVVRATSKQPAKKAGGIAASQRSSIPTTTMADACGNG